MAALSKAQVEHSIDAFDVMEFVYASNRYAFVTGFCDLKFYRGDDTFIRMVFKMFRERMTDMSEQAKYAGDDEYVE